jgi:hypothetical protein
VPNLTAKPRGHPYRTRNRLAKETAMLIGTFKGLLVSAAVTAGLLTGAAPGSAQADGAAPPARAAAEQGSLGLIGYSGHAGFCGVDVSADHIESYAVVTNNNDPDTMAIARANRDSASAAYQHNQTDLEHG